MNINSFVGFDILKKSVPIIQVLEHYGLTERLHRSGENLNGVCPLHHGHNPSQFRVSISKNCWICFGDCHAGGSIVDFVSRKEGIGIRDAALLIQDWFGVKPLRTDPYENKDDRKIHTRTQAATSRVQSKYRRNPPLGFRLTNLDQDHEYLKEREFSKKTLADFGVGYCSKGTMAGRIVIPIHNSRGQLIAYAGRWPGNPPDGKPKYTLPKGFHKSLELFNLHRASTVERKTPLVVVEGFFGCMKVWEAGHKCVVSIMGSMLSKAQEDLLIQTVSPNGQVILLFDEDLAGRKGRADAFQRLQGRVNLRVVSFDREGAQPDRSPLSAIKKLIA